MDVNATLDQQLAHMAWANAEMCSVLTTLPEAAYAYTSPGSEWSVGAIAHHLTTAAENYAQRLHGEPRAEKRELPTTAADLQALAAALAIADAKLRAGAHLPGDEFLTWISFNDSRRLYPRLRRNPRKRRPHHRRHHRVGCAASRRDHQAHQYVLGLSVGARANSGGATDRRGFV